VGFPDLLLGVYKSPPDVFDKLISVMVVGRHLRRRVFSDRGLGVRSRDFG
jgi:hypothetical protein